MASLPKERRALAIAAGLGAVVLVIVLLAIGTIGGGDSGSGANPSSTAENGAETKPAADSTDVQARPTRN